MKSKRETAFVAFFVGSFIAFIGWVALYLMARTFYRRDIMGPGLVAIEYKSGIRLYAIDKQGEQSLKSLDPEIPLNGRCLEKFDRGEYAIFKPLEAIEVMVRK